jgi:hypothetical protein
VGDRTAQDQLVLDEVSDEEGDGSQSDAARRPERWEKRREAVERELRTALVACSVFVKMAFP